MISFDEVAPFAAFAGVEMVGSSPSVERSKVWSAADDG